MTLAEQNIAGVSAIIREAGAMALRHIGEMVLYTEKGRNNFVTKIDFEIQDFLRKKLLGMIPGSRILSEEEEFHNACSDPSSKYLWVIDPVDGTTNIIHGYPHCSVTIALFEDGTPALGAIYQPFTDELFHAVAGGGAYLNGNTVRVSSVDRMSDALVGFGFPYDRSKTSAIVGLIGEISPCVHGLRRSGSAALDLAYVACGRLDAYFEYDLEVWDYIAGSLLIAEAGGTVTDWRKNELLGRGKSNVAASNGAVHAEFLGFLG